MAEAVWSMCRCWQLPRANCLSVFSLRGSSPTGTTKCLLWSIRAQISDGTSSQTTHRMHGSSTSSGVAQTHLTWTWWTMTLAAIKCDFQGKIQILGINISTGLRFPSKTRAEILKGELLAVWSMLCVIFSDSRDYSQRRDRRDTIDMRASSTEGILMQVRIKLTKNTHCKQTFTS